MRGSNCVGTGRAVKIACRNLWKVYGPSPTSFFHGREPKSDSTALAERLRSANHIPAVVDASFDIEAGEIFVVMGLSGSGKSTLVRCLSRLIEPTSGEVLLDGRDLMTVSKRELIRLRRHEMGMVFQNFGLLPHLTVLDNVALPLRIQGRAIRERQARAREMIELVGLQGRERALPHELSGGQQQRVGIARSLAVGPQLWFLDEPFSALDPLIRRQMQDEFLQLQKLLHKTIVFITHDIQEAFRLGNRLAIMRDGTIIQIGRPADIVLKPADAYVAQFTEDVPLARVITAGDLMSACPETPIEAQAIPASLSLEELIPRLAAGAKAFTVLGDENRPIGILPAETVLKILGADMHRRKPR